MKLVIAQGNPGPEYEKTRHNVGFLAIDFYAASKGADFQTKSKFNAEIAEIHENGEKTLLVKPLTYYNETGNTARPLADFYKINTTNILAIHDELALPFGTIRTREKGSDAGNNGVKSLNAHLGENYARIRIGTWNELADKQGSFDFVLSKFSSDEYEKLHKDVFPKTNDLIDDFIRGSLAATSHSL